MAVFLHPHGTLYVYFLKSLLRHPSFVWSVRLDCCLCLCPTAGAFRRRPLHGGLNADVVDATAGEPMRLVIRPLPEARASLALASTKANFIGRLTSADRIVNVDVSR